MVKRGFASDNNSGVHPKVMEALMGVNQGHVVGYGDDTYTDAAIKTFKKHFGNEVEVFFVFNGTGGNVLAIQTLAQSFHSIICPHTAHINVDECGAPEKVTGSKLVPIETKNGKLTPELVEPHLHGFDFEHHSQPGIISISQVTEMGTLYSVDEIKALSKLAHNHRMFLHMDGARIANAAVALGLEFKDFTVDAGVDVVTFGGTKNGLMFGEAVLFFNKSLTTNTKYFRKQSSQLFSKMRFISAQFSTYLEDELWKENATHANNMAKLLAQKAGEIGVVITQKTEANGVFVKLPKSTALELQKHYFFYPWDENNNEYRWMTAFDTTRDDIENFCNLLSKLPI